MHSNIGLRRRNRRGMGRAAATVAAAAAALPLLATAGEAQIGSHWFEPPKPRAEPAPQPPAAPRRLYRLADFGALRDRKSTGDVGSRGVALNELGQAVCVTHDYAGRAFVASPGAAPREIEPLPGLPRLRPTAINERGEVVGTAHSEDLQERRRAFLWKAGTTTELPTPEGEISEGLDINDRGEVVGTSYARHLRGDGQKESFGHHAFIWSRTRGLSELDHIAGWSHSLVINNVGQVAGGLSALGIHESREEAKTRRLPDTDGQIPNRAFLIARPEPSAPAVGLRVTDSWDSTVTDINEEGQMVGTRYEYRYVLRAPRLFTWTGGKATDLDVLEGLGGTRPRLNNRGSVVCSVAVRPADAAKPGHRTRPALYEAGARLWLDECLEPAAVEGGWRLVEASDINDRGQILGTAVRDGRSRAVLLTPLP